MRDLRRDVFERRMWPLLAVLLVAIVAVLILLSTRGSSASPTAAAVPAAPASATPAAQAARPTATGRQAVSVSNHGSAGRDPFSSRAAPAQTAAATTVSAGTSAGSGSASGHQASTDALATQDTHTTSSLASAGQLSGLGSAHATGVTTSAASTAARSGASTVPARSTGARTSRSETVATRSWTIYHVGVSYGEKGYLRRLSDLARFTPLPSATVPEVLFDGMTAGGRDAVFQLALGVTPSGPAQCRPSRRLCTAIILPVHAVETLTLTPSSGPSTLITVQVNRVQATVTHSVTTAVAALKRVSALGVCELSMANSVAFDPETLTASARSPRCAHGRKLMPFLGIGGA